MIYGLIFWDSGCDYFASHTKFIVYLERSWSKQMHTPEHQSRPCLQQTTSSCRHQNRGWCRSGWHRTMTVCAKNWNTWCKQAGLYFRFNCSHAGSNTRTCCLQTDFCWKVTDSSSLSQCRRTCSRNYQGMTKQSTWLPGLTEQILQRVHYRPVKTTGHEIQLWLNICFLWLWFHTPGMQRNPIWLK